MTLEDLMRELGSRLGLGEIELEEDGGAQIQLGDDLAVDISRDGQDSGFHFSAAIGPAPNDAREAIFAELLEANLVGQGTGGAALALDSVLGEIVLCRSLSQDDLPFEAFEQELLNFVQALQYWRERYAAGEIGKGSAAGTEAVEPPMDKPPPGMVRV